MVNLLDALRRAILASGKSRYSIAKATRIDQSRLSRFMSGESGLSVEAVQQLADYLGLEIVIRPKRQKKAK